MANEKTDTSRVADELDLADLDLEYAQAAAAEGESEPVPDGTYEAVVEQTELVRAKSSATLMLRWTLRLTSEAVKGRRLWKYGAITPKALPFLKSDLTKCQLELAKLSDLPAQLKHLVGLKLVVTKRAEGDYTRVYFEKLITNGAAGAPVVPGTPRRDTDLPAL